MKEVLAKLVLEDGTELTLSLIHILGQIEFDGLPAVLSGYELRYILHRARSVPVSYTHLDINRFIIK